MTRKHDLERPAGAEDRDDVAGAGLCARCVHLRVLRSRKATHTSTFVRCALSDVDDRFPRYPGLPVSSCAGFEPWSEG